METQIELIKKDLTLFKEETERRINLLEENIKKLTGEERNLSDNILKFAGLLTSIQDSISRLEKSTEEGFERVHSRIDSTKDDFKAKQQRELESYLAYKRVVIGAALTAIVGGLMGAVLTSYRLFGG